MRKMRVFQQAGEQGIVNLAKAAQAPEHQNVLLDHRCDLPHTTHPSNNCQGRCRSRRGGLRKEMLLMPPMFSMQGWPSGLLKSTR